MIDTSFMVGNPQSIFLPTKTKDFISNTEKTTQQKQTHLEVNHCYHPLLCSINVYLYVDTLI